MATNPNKPTLGENVMVWPTQRTVRDDARQPVTKDGVVQTVTARVRDANGNLITDAIPVRVNVYYYKLIVQGNLDWCTPEQYRQQLADEAAAKKAAAKQPAPAPVADPALAATEHPAPEPIVAAAVEEPAPDAGVQAHDETAH